MIDQIQMAKDLFGDHGEFELTDDGRVRFTVQKSKVDLGRLIAANEFDVPFDYWHDRCENEDDALFYAEFVFISRPARNDDLPILSLVARRQVQHWSDTENYEGHVVFPAEDELEAFNKLQEATFRLEIAQAASERLEERVHDIERLANLGALDPIMSDVAAGIAKLAAALANRSVAA